MVTRERSAFLDTVIRRRWRRSLLVVLVLVFTIAGLVILLLGSTRAPLDGHVRTSFLRHSVQIRFARGNVPTIRARTLSAAFYAEGYLEGAERFFQMDLIRRSAEGRLAALFGPRALPLDRRAIRYGFRALALRVWRRASPETRRYLTAFTAGVNKALASIPTRPLPYWILGRSPRPWRPWDTYLVIAYMYRYLQSPSDHLARALGVMRAHLPRPLYRFLAAPGNRWDAPDLGPPWHVPAIPGPQVFSWATAGIHATSSQSVHYLPPSRAASNSFAVEGRLTLSGHALLANDPHLPLSLPPIWYRLTIECCVREERRLVVTGVTLPGVPGVVIGTNGLVAWSMTDAMVSDEMLLAVRRLGPTTYQGPHGPLRFATVTHDIPVRGGRPMPVRVVTTVWGPVLVHGHHGHDLVMDWLGEDPAAYRIAAFFALLRARNLRQALADGSRIGMPAQNFVVATRRGNIGWTVAGPVLARRGRCGILPHPVRAIGGRCQPAGILAPRRHPVIIDPPGGFLWTANQRVVGGRALRLLGEGGAGYDLGARARQIRNDLRALTSPLRVADLLAIERDDRAIYLAHWRRLFLKELAKPLAPRHEQSEVRNAVLAWGGRASAGSIGFRLVHDFRRRVFALVLAPFSALLRRDDPHFKFPDPSMLEGPVWKLVTERPAWLCPPAVKDWPALLRRAARQVVVRAWRRGARGFRHETWGAWNELRLGGPLGAAGGLLAWIYDLPPRPMSGDANMPRVIVRNFGASMRWGLAVGDPTSGYLELPGGESEDPFSRHYTDELRAWLVGERAPLLPPLTDRVLTLVPARVRP